MWTVRILTGPQKGESFPLSNGVNKIGRQQSCAVALNHPQISKTHACIEVYNDRIIVSDMGSRNGTFVNGIKIKRKAIKIQDRISIYDIHLQVFPVARPQLTPNSQDHSEESHLQSSPPPHSELSNNHTPYVNPSYPPASEHKIEVNSKESFDHFIKKSHQYIEDTILPVIYRLPEVIEWQWALGIFILLFSTIVTLLSAIPATYMLRSSVENEAQRRATSIASAMARENRHAIANRLQTALNIQPALSEPGIQKALIVSNPDGKIMAPSNLAGQYASDTPFVYSAIKIKSEIVESLDNHLIGVSIPIKLYNPSTGSDNILANAIVIYDMSSIAINSSQVLGLYIQIFAISLIFGSLLLFLIYKITNYPIREINKQFDGALKDEISSVSSSYQLSSIQLLISNINSALNRMNQSTNESEMNIEYDRSHELSHLVQLIGFGAIGITAHNLSIAAINQEFEEKTSLNEHDLLYKPIEEITDQALKLSIKDLIERAQNQSNQIVTNELELAGFNYEIAVQSVYGQNTISYFLIVLLPNDDPGDHQ